MDVLLVDDEALVRETLAEDLADAGLDVAEAPDAEAALEAASAAAGEADGPPRVLITDVNLGPGMDGLALAAEARRRWPEVGVVVMTGRPANLNGRGPDPREVCLLKPFGPPRLAAAVRHLMGRSRRGAASPETPPAVGAPTVRRGALRGDRGAGADRHLPLPHVPARVRRRVHGPPVHAHRRGEGDQGPAARLPLVADCAWLRGAFADRR